MASRETQEFYQQNQQFTYDYPDIPANLITKLQKFNWITGTNRTPYLEVGIAGPWADMLEEARCVDHLFVEHRGGYDHQGWSSLCIHGLGATLTDSVGAYPEYKNIPESQLPYKWTEIADLCPVTTNYFKTKFPYQKYFRIRYMRLDPGGYISPHHDSTSFIMGAVNISLNNPLGCSMVLDGVGVVPFKDTGSVIAFNNSYEHIVWNQSAEPRYHIIVHGMWAPQWMDLVVNSYKT
ncbi:Aspartyl/asparaginy/proline hydroxylase [uncultured Caudovirales phage]|uniref:Aspartyl/asparaginy/proline hydroxylase n=1 Tax=uncultured Caudovirales phage TaxID=2100421 RepID=A0A6J5L3J5_9CAUD|nr:Aspartyl/asparaginy/proline hydroxylase [uncultured Caudovirales phage]